MEYIRRLARGVLHGDITAKSRLKWNPYPPVDGGKT